MTTSSNANSPQAGPPPELDIEPPPSTTGAMAAATTPGGYQLVSKLGSGGMADIYLAVQRGEGDFKRLVVVKKVQGRHLESPKLVTMFYDEARIVASLSHPHIVKIFDLRRVGDDVSIAMEYVDGEALSLINRTLKKNGLAMPLPIVLKLMLDACDALHTAHTAVATDGTPLKIIHRDVSPQNLMLDSNGYLKLIDFGIAKTAIQTDMTSPGGIKGKISYLAPETFRTRNIDERVDVYGLGLVLWELLLQTRAIELANDAPMEEVMQTVLAFEPGAVSQKRAGLPAELDLVMATALAADVNKRYPTMEHFAADLRRLAPAMGGVASASEIKRWFQATFKARLDKRRAFEADAFQRADQLLLRAAQAAVPGDGAASQLPRATSLGGAPSGSQSLSLAELQPPPTTGQTQAGHTALQQVTQGSKPFWLLAFLFVLFVGGAVIVQRLFFQPQPPIVVVSAPPVVPTTPTTPATPPPTAPVKGEPRGSAPAFAPARDDELMPEGNAPRVAGADGRAADGRAADAKAADSKKNGKRLPPPKKPARGAPSSAAASAPEPEPPVVEAPVAVASPPPAAEPPPPAPEPIKLPPLAPAKPAVPAKQWYSGGGGWSGKQVLEQGCTRCHGVSAQAKTRRQWERFFQRDMHTKNGDLDLLFSDGEQTRALEAILLRLDDKKADGVAGVK